MTKKKILIINKSFQLGGIEVALANLVDEICDLYDVTLAVFYPQGPMRERVPENVRLLKLSPFVEVFGMSLKDCMAHGTVLQKIFKVVGSTWTKLFGNALPAAFALAFQEPAGTYDVVISYHQEMSSKTLMTGFGQFALKKCAAKKKIAWIHADVVAAGVATRKNLKTYEKFDQIVCVSKAAMEIFKTAYPTLVGKCDYCYNSVPVAEIMEKSRLEQNVFAKTDNDFILFSACRLAKEKGLIPALQNLRSTFENHPNLKWFIAGAGPLEQQLRSLISEYRLENQVFLLGIRKNPYPYMREADYLFLPSLHESFSMVANEAHVLGTPVIASDIPVMWEVRDEYDYLCSNHEYASVIEELVRRGVRKSYPEEMIDLSDWKTQFERILEC